MWTCVGCERTATSRRTPLTHYLSARGETKKAANTHDMRRTFCGRDGADEWKAHTLYILPEGVFWVGLISVLMWIVLRLSEGFVIARKRAEESSSRF